MLRAVFLISLLLVSHSVLPQDERVSPGRSAISLHTPWENLLQEYVQDDGRVNYKGLLKDQQRLKSYLEGLALKPPQEDWTPGARMAYYVNLYNAGTVALILENYPVKSIRDIDRPWAKRRVQVGTEWLSLGDIEHKILRKMGDARIHFAINCASISCPKLPEYAFTEAEIEAQLERAAREFINDTNRNTIYADRAEVSRIFKWFRSDFKADDASLIEYLNHYLEKPIPDGTPIGFLPYDWSLNDSDL